MGFKHWKVVKRVAVYWLPGSIPLGWREPIKHDDFEQVGALLNHHSPYYREVEERLKLSRYLAHGGSSFSERNLVSVPVVPIIRQFFRRSIVH